MNIVSLYRKPLMAIAIIATPFSSFISNNLYDLDSVVLRTLVILFIIILSLVFLTSKIFEFFYKKIGFELYAFFLSFGFFLCFYFYTFIRDLFFIFIPNYYADLAFVLTILIFIIFFVFSYIRKNLFVINLALIYLSLSFILSFAITFSGIIKITYQDFSASKNLSQEKLITQTTSNLEKNNMYFIIMDAAISLKKFDEYYNTNHTTNYEQKFDNLGFSYIHNTRSAYNNTKNSIASLFHMDYHINFKNYKKYSTNNVYPTLLQKYKAGNLPLIKNLKKLDYNFYWLGNSSSNCELYNKDFCFGNDSNIATKNLLSPYVINSFLERSPIIPIYYRIKNFLTKTEQKQEFNYEFKKNDSINNFLKKIESINIKNNNFFFIHANMPHAPYLYGSDCSKNNTKNETINTGYKKSYECMLNRLISFSEYINKYDPNANVIITSDHGQFLYNKTENGKEKIIAHTFNTFTLIKINKKCGKYLDNQLNIPNGIRLLLSCSSSLKIELLEPKSYYITYAGAFTSGDKRKLFEIKSRKEDEFAAEFLLIARDELNSYIEAVEKGKIKPTDFKNK